jgi:hypothetical protein
MSGNPTLSPTCSLDIRIYTPATSPTTQESSAAGIADHQEPISLKLYKTKSNKNHGQMTLGDRVIEPTSTREPLTTMTRRLPQLTLNIPLAMSIPRSYDAGDTTTPPLSPESELPGGMERNEYRQMHLSHTLDKLTEHSRPHLHRHTKNPRPKLALNIPTYPSRGVQLQSAGETTTPPLSPQYYPATAQHLIPHDVGDCKLTRRSLTSGHGPRRKPTLINLHPYIQALIIHHLAKNEWLDKYSLRATCRRFYSLIGPPRPEGFDLYQWPYLKDSLLSCKDCLRLRQRTEFVDFMRLDTFRAGGSAARDRYCIDCGLKEQFVAGKRIPPRLKKRTRLKVDGVEFVVCIYCGEFGQAPSREETWFTDCCRQCFVDASRCIGLLGPGVSVPPSTPSILKRQHLEWC